MPRFDDAIGRVLEDVASAMTPRLQQFAKHSGWPDEAARALSVGVERGRLVPDYGDDRTVEDLEYGTTSRAPRAAIGNFFSSHTVRREVEGVTLDSMDPLIEHVDRIFA